MKNRFARWKGEPMATLPEKKKKPEVNGDEWLQDALGLDVKNPYRPRLKPYFDPRKKRFNDED